MKISVIVPVLNEEDCLERCLRSLFLQVWPPDEIICCIDEETTDGSQLIVHGYPPTRAVAAPHGKLSVRDIGIRQARGEIIVSVDADCIYPPNFIEEINWLFQDPEIIAACGWHRPSILPLDSIYHAWYRRRLSGSASAFRKHAYLKLGGFNLNIDQHDNRAMVAEEEIGLLKRMRELGKIAWIHTPSRHLRHFWQGRV